MPTKEELEDLSIFITSGKGTKRKKTYWFYNETVCDSISCDDVSIGLFIKNNELKIICYLRLDGEKYFKIFDELGFLKSFMIEFDQFNLDYITIENLLKER